MSCYCISMANKALAESNARIDLREMLDMKTGVMRRVLCVPTAKINSKSRKGGVVLVATFCPMCGVRVNP